MKKLIYFFSIAFLLFQSCSSSDNSQNSTLDTSLLFKKWYIVSQTYNGVKSNGYVCSNGNRDYLEFKEPNILNYYFLLKMLKFKNLCNRLYFYIAIVCF